MRNIVKMSTYTLFLVLELVVRVFFSAYFEYIFSDVLVTYFLKMYSIQGYMVL